MSSRRKDGPSHVLKSSKSSTKCQLIVTVLLATLTVLVLSYIFHRHQQPAPAHATNPLPQQKIEATQNKKHVPDIRSTVKKAPIKPETSTVQVPGVSSFDLTSKIGIGNGSTSNHNSAEQEISPLTSLTPSRKMKWSEFLQMPITHSNSINNAPSVSGSTTSYLPSTLELHICPTAVSRALAQPSLSKQDVDFCKWALKPANYGGAGVVVGKSWGALSKALDRIRFDSLNCNAVETSGVNPSCAESWGDKFIQKWAKHNDPDQAPCGSTTTAGAGAGNSNYGNSSSSSGKGGSGMQCYLNDNKDRFCVLEKVMIDFSKQKKINKGSMQPASKKFQQDFMTLQCEQQHHHQQQQQQQQATGATATATRSKSFTFTHLLSTQTSRSTKQVCDYVLEGTTLLYSHDNIRNLAHTHNDLMNVWAMLWLDGQAGNIHNISFLTIDALKQYNNFDDKINQFYTTYRRLFQRILRGNDFPSDATLCLQRVLVQPLPAVGFVWHNWQKDLPCSFVGPSAMYQRWNLHVRSAYPNMLHVPPPPPPAQQQQQQQQQSSSSPIGNAAAGSRTSTGTQIMIIKVVVIVRTESKNDWGSYRSSRLIRNLPEIQQALAELQKSPPIIGSKPVKFDVVYQNLALLSFEEQLQLISETSILIGMHGAGITHSQYMSVGTKAFPCCGVVEIFPRGEFFPVKGFANMIRKLGLSYARVDVSKADSQASGAIVPVKELTQALQSMLTTIHRKPSCVLENVVKNPYLLF